MLAELIWAGRGAGQILGTGVGTFVTPKSRSLVFCFHGVQYVSPPLMKKGRAQLGRKEVAEWRADRGRQDQASSARSVV